MGPPESPTAQSGNQAGRRKRLARRPRPRLCLLKGCVDPFVPILARFLISPAGQGIGQLSAPISRAAALMRLRWMPNSHASRMTEPGHAGHLWQGIVRREPSENRNSIARDDSIRARFFSRGIFAVRASIWARFASVAVPIPQVHASRLAGAGAALLARGQPGAPRRRAGAVEPFGPANQFRRTMSSGWHSFRRATR